MAGCEQNNMNVVKNSIISNLYDLGYSYAPSVRASFSNKSHSQSVHTIIIITVTVTAAAVAAESVLPVQIHWSREISSVVNQ